MADQNDLTVYDPNDWQIHVDGAIMEQPVKFEVTPEFGADTQLIETLYGEVGFTLLRTSSKGTARISLADTSPSNKKLMELARARKVVKVACVNVANPSRYPISQNGLTYAIIRPAARTVDKTPGVREWEAIGFGHFEDVAKAS